MISGDNIQLALFNHGRRIKWITLYRALPSDLWRKKYMNGNEKILYHYCSVETFFNIVKGANLWLSDMAKSNDYQEFIVCREIVNERIKEYLKNDNKSLEIWKNGIEMELR
jgi:hypothetical protein